MNIHRKLCQYTVDILDFFKYDDYIGSSTTDGVLVDERDVDDGVVVDVDGDVDRGPVVGGDVTVVDETVLVDESVVVVYLTEFLDFRIMP